MASEAQVIYTVGILATVVILLLFLRGMFIRRARAIAIASASPASSQPQRVQVMVVGGGWRDGGIGGVGGRGQWRVPTDLPRPQPARTAPSSTNQVPTRHAADEVLEDLPRYEAPPPEYHAVVKSEQEAAAGFAAGRQAPLGYTMSHGEEGRPDTVIEMGRMPPPGQGVGAAASEAGATAGTGPQSSSASSSSPPPPSPPPPAASGGIAERLWGRFGRR